MNRFGPRKNKQLRRSRFLNMKPPHSVDGMDFLQLAYKPDAYLVSNDHYVHEIENQLENNQYVLKNFFPRRHFWFTIIVHEFSWIYIC